MNISLFIMFNLFPFEVLLMFSNLYTKYDLIPNQKTPFLGGDLDCEGKKSFNRSEERNLILPTCLSLRILTSTIWQWSQKHNVSCESI